MKAKSRRTSSGLVWAAGNHTTTMPSSCNTAACSGAPTRKATLPLPKSAPISVKTIWPTMILCC